MSTEFEKNVYRKFDDFDKKFESIDKKFDSIDKKFDSIDKEFKSIDKRFDGIDKFQKEANEKFDDIDKFQKEANEKFDKIFHILDVIRESQILVEHQVMVKIPALFDGYAMHQQKQEILENNINSLDRKVEDHDIRLSILEQQSV